jgi:RNA recognition motif-containing protein
MKTAVARNQPGYTAIVVEELAEETSEQDIRSLFGQYGAVSAIRLIPSASNRRGDGCCYLKMRDRPAKVAISTLNGKAFGGSILRVTEAPALPSELPKPRPSAEDELTRGPTRLIYHVASVEKAAMPAGAQGDDWYRYVLSSGRSRITGFHRGSHSEVKAFASQCAEEFNLRSERGKIVRPTAHAKKK